MFVFAFDCIWLNTETRDMEWNEIKNEKLDMENFAWK